MEREVVTLPGETHLGSAPVSLLCLSFELARDGTMHQEAAVPGRHRRNKGLREKSKYVLCHKLSSLTLEDFLSVRS